MAVLRSEFDERRRKSSSENQKHAGRYLLLHHSWHSTVCHRLSVLFFRFIKAEENARREAQLQREAQGIFDFF